MICMAGEHRDDRRPARERCRDATFTLKELVRLLESLPPVADGEPDDLADRVASTAQAARAAGFAGNPYDEDVADPLGMPLETYRAIAWELDEWIGRLRRRAVRSGRRARGQRRGVSDADRDGLPITPASPSRRT